MAANILKAEGVSSAPKHAQSTIRPLKSAQARVAMKSMLSSAMDARQENQNPGGDFCPGQHDRKSPDPRSGKKGERHEGHGKLLARAGFDDSRVKKNRPEDGTDGKDDAPGAEDHGWRGGQVVLVSARILLQPVT